MFCPKKKVLTKHFAVTILCGIKWFAGAKATSFLFIVFCR